MHRQSCLTPIMTNFVVCFMRKLLSISKYQRCLFIIGEPYRRALAKRANATVSSFGNTVVLAHAFVKLFSKTKCPVYIKASYGILISTVILQGTKKHAILSRLGVFIKRNAWDVSSIRHATCIRIPKERHQLLR